MVIQGDQKLLLGDHYPNSLLSNVAFNERYQESFRTELKEVERLKRCELTISQISDGSWTGKKPRPKLR